MTTNNEKISPNINTSLELNKFFGEQPNLIIKKIKSFPTVAMHFSLLADELKKLGAISPEIEKMIGPHLLNAQEQVITALNTVKEGKTDRGKLKAEIETINEICNAMSPHILDFKVNSRILDQNPVKNALA